jgi:hypothetical protein
MPPEEQHQHEETDHVTQYHVPASNPLNTDLASG